MTKSYQEMLTIPFYISSFFGSACFTRNLKFSYFFLPLVFIQIIAFVLFLMLYSRLDDFGCKQSNATRQTEDEDLEKKYFIFFEIPDILLMSGYPFILTSLIINHEVISSSLNKIIQIEANLNYNKFDFNYRSIPLAYLLCIVNILDTIHKITNDACLQNATIIVLSLIGFRLTQCQMVTFINFTSNLFEKIKENLEIQRNTLQIIQVHYSLCSVSDSLCKCYSSFGIISILHEVALVTHTFYCVIVDPKYLNNSGFSTMLAISIATIFCIFISGHRLTNQSELFYRQLQKEMLNETNEGFMQINIISDFHLPIHTKKEDILSLYLLRRQIVPVDCNSYMPLSKPNILTILGTIATFIAIFSSTAH